MPTYFDNLLESLDADAKTQLGGLIEKAPVIREKLDEAGKMLDWATNNWDHDHGMTKSEYAQAQIIRNLESQIATGGEMTLEELNSKLDSYMSEKKLVDRGTFESELNTRVSEAANLIKTMGEVATRVPYLNAKYKDEFGEYFDPDQFLQAAQKAPGIPLDKFYENEFIADKRAAKSKAEFEKAVNEAKEAGIREGLQRKTENGVTGSPTLDGSPNIGSFQQKIMGMKQGADRAVIPEGAELGSGVIARAAALAADRAELGSFRGGQ